MSDILADIERGVKTWSDFKTPNAAKVVGSWIARGRLTCERNSEGKIIVSTLRPGNGKNVVPCQPTPTPSNDAKRMAHERANMLSKLYEQFAHLAVDLLDLTEGEVAQVTAPINHYFITIDYNGADNEKG